MATQFIPLSVAAQMTKKYRESREMILDPAYRGRDILAICESFNREEFDQVLAQEGCTGLRIYFGMDDNMLIKAVICGVDAENRDMIPSSTSSTDSKTTAARSTDEGENGQIIDQGLRCPTNCPPDSDLN